MKNLTAYDSFLTEAVSSAISSFLKTYYNNVFQDPDQNLNNLFIDFTKRIDREKNTANLYQRFLRNFQTNVQTEINNSETIDAANKIISDSIKYFYFSLKPIVNKLQNDEFTMEEIFSRSRDKRMMKLMSYPEDQFSNAVTQYIGDAVTPWIKKEAGLEKQPTQQTQQPQQPQQNQPTTTTERIKYNIAKILEADTTDVNADLVSYKKSAINWINLSLFDLIKPKMQLLNQLGANTSNSVDQLANQMKGTTNDNAKKIILNKILNMDNTELKNLANTLGLKEEETGKI